MNDRIANLRKNKKMTQEDLAYELGFKSKASVSCIEKDGKNHKEPSALIIAKIARIFGTTADYIFFGETIQNEKEEAISIIKSINNVDNLKIVIKILKTFKE